MTSFNIEAPEFRVLWDTLVTTGIGLLDDKRGPLVGLSEAATHLGLSPLPRLKFGGELDVSDGLPIGALSELDETGLILLRKYLYYSKPDDRLSDWAEKLLLYCEIHRLRLRKKLVARFGDKVRSELFLLQMVALLIDFYNSYKDVRFLNSGLKVYYSHWRRAFRGLSLNSQKYPLNFVCTLFHVRFLLLSERALQQLSVSS